MGAAEKRALVGAVEVWALVGSRNGADSVGSRTGLCGRWAGSGPGTSKTQVVPSLQLSPAVSAVKYFHIPNLYAF